MSDTDFSYQLNKFTPTGPSKDSAIPRFHTQTIHLEFASKQAGRPLYEEREFVEIIVPGQRRSQVVEPVNDEHKARWPDAYKAFKDGREIPPNGTPLANWPNSLLNRARVEELAFFHIRTVEDLAVVNDANLQNLGMGARELREAAKKFLEVAKNGTGPLEKLINENFRLKDEIVRKDAQLAEQASIIAGLRAEIGARPYAGA